MTTPDAPSGDRDRAWSDRGGYVRGFEERLRPARLRPRPRARSPRSTRSFSGPCTSPARPCATRRRRRRAPTRTGAILGNLSFPTGSHARFAEHVWLAGTSLPRIAARGWTPRPDARNRFSVGPARAPARPRARPRGPALLPRRGVRVVALRDRPGLSGPRGWRGGLDARGRGEPRRRPLHPRGLLRPLGDEQDGPEPPLPRRRRRAGARRGLRDARAPSASTTPSQGGRSRPRRHPRRGPLQRRPRARPPRPSKRAGARDARRVGRRARPLPRRGLLRRVPRHRDARRRRHRAALDARGLRRQQEPRHRVVQGQRRAPGHGGGRRGRHEGARGDGADAIAPTPARRRAQRRPSRERRSAW